MNQSIALLALALLLGGMVFFAAVVAPLVFTRLPGNQAGPFIRQVFPVYYLYVLAMSAVAAVALMPLRLPDAMAMAITAAATLWLRQGLMPRINRLSDAAQAGDESARRGFDRAHRLSVVMNCAQIILAAGVLVRFAWV